MAEYLCAICSEPCLDEVHDTIQCSHCQNWVHNTCSNLTKLNLKQWSPEYLQFLCKCCAFDGPVYNYTAALERLKRALASTNKADILNQAKSESKLLETYNVNVPVHDKLLHNSYEVDHESVQILNMFHPVMNTEFNPLQIVGDGNCLYRAVSLALTGSQAYHSLLRLLAALELIHNRPSYDTRRKYNDFLKDTRIVTSAYQKIVKDAVTDKTYSEMAHIYAVSAALGIGIQSYYPPQLNSEISSAFTRNVLGRKVGTNSSSKITLMWTCVIVPETHKQFQVNHFVPLVPKTSCVKITAIEHADNASSKPGNFVTEFDNTAQSELDLDWPSKSDITISEMNENLSTSDYETKPYSFSAPLDVSESNLKQQKEADSFHKSFDQTEPDDMHASVYQNDNGECQHSVVSDSSDIDADSTQESVNTDSDDSLSGQLNGAFLDVNSVIRLLQQSDRCLEQIPAGLKENIYFVVRNDQNLEKRKKGHNSRFSDDCGVWKGSKGGTPVTTFLVLPSGEMKGIVKRENEGYCFKRKSKGTYQYVKLNPQSLENEIIELHRYYTKLKKDETYQKRVSWLGLGGDNEIAVVEFIGKFPGVAPHGNAKYKTEYIRTPDNVMTEMSEMLKSHKPKQVYDKLTNKHDELNGPTDPRQVRDMKRCQENKERRQAGLTGSRQNIADPIIEIENKVSRNDPFIRSVIRQNGKAPCIILHNDEQIQDMKQLCCTGQTVLGVDKTFNLCDMHVTVTCYKQLSVTKTSTSEPPLFIGPIFIHDNSDFDTYSNFFFNLKIKLKDVDTSSLVIGTDDERALVNAIKTAFPQSKHILCTRHLRQNATQKLTDDAVDKYDKKTILDKIFGDDGLIQADDTICFEEKCEELETLSQSISKNFLRYFQKRLKDLIREKRRDPEVANQSDKLWTNNNCESLNHVLKQAIDWKSKPLLDFITYVQELVDAQFKDLKRAIVGTGQFRLAESHSHFAVSKSVWANKTDDERNRLYRRFRSHVIKNTRLIKSTDGHSDVVAPRTKGQKIGQRKRKRTERTTTVPVKKTKN